MLEVVMVRFVGLFLSACLDWVGSDWIGLDWTGLDWTGLDCIGLDWFGFPLSVDDLQWRGRIRVVFCAQSNLDFTCAL